ncbi:hypothetical protein ACH4UV_38455, partial [Streptomyces sp. NPDC020802]
MTVRTDKWCPPTWQPWNGQTPTPYWNCSPRERWSAHRRGPAGPSTPSPPATQAMEAGAAVPARQRPTALGLFTLAYLMGGA